jgi:glycosyltransferase involved in cell wall biosynthesis
MLPATPHVLLVAGRLAHWSEAGRLQPLIARLTERSLEVAVLCVTNDGILDERSGVVESPGLAIRWQKPWALRRLRLGVESNPPHLLHVLQEGMTRVGLWLADRWRIPYVQTVEEFIPSGGRLPVSRRWCRALVAPSQDVADDLVHNLGVPERLVSVVPPGVPGETGKGSKPVAPPELSRVPVLGAAGRFVEGSGLAVFLKAARGLVDAGIDAEFVIAGNGPREAELRRGAERLRISDRVTFAEEPTPEGTFWKVLDIFCQTSLVPTAGRTLALALAHGVPAVASDVEGLRSLVTDGLTGIRVPPGNPDALTQCMIALLTDRSRARELAERGRDQVAEAFHPSREAQLLADLYQRIVASSEQTMSAAIPSQ